MQRQPAHEDRSTEARGFNDKKKKKIIFEIKFLKNYKDLGPRALHCGFIEFFLYVCENNFLKYE